MADRKPDPRSLWIVSELYYPEETSTGYILTQIAEGLTADFRVRVACGQPSYSARGVKAPWRETRHGVEIYRCLATTWSKDSLPKRLVNLITISCSIFLKLLWHLRRKDRVLVVTNPPTLPLLAAFACRLRRAECLLLIHDVYPEVAVAAGLLPANSVRTRVLNRWMRRLYRSVARIIVLGRDMQELVRRKCADHHDRTVVITNWADLDLVRPLPRSENRLLEETGVTHKFVVQCAGNMGPVHDVESIVECAKQLRHHADIHFLLIGSGAKKAWVERFIRERQLDNVTLLPPRPRSESPDFLNACDLAISALVPGMLGVSVPCRSYNILAAGKPVIAVADPASELGRVIAEERVGWVVPPGDVDALAAAVLEAKERPEELAQMCRRARAAVDQKYQSGQIIRAFARVIHESYDTPGRAGSPAAARSG